MAYRIVVGIAVFEGFAIGYLAVIPAKILVTGMIR